MLVREDSTATTEILVVDDDATTRARLQNLLQRNGYTTELAEDGASAWSLLKRKHFSFILTDWAMPNVDGLTLCQRIRDADYPDYTYIILLTGHTEKRKVERGLDAGADDYITKPFDSGELLARVRVGVRILALQRQMSEQRRKLEELASLDGLTGVLNRRALETRLDEAFSLARRRNHPISVAMLDLDRFKAVNDTYGHQAGDVVLQETARRIKDVTRDYDSVGRFGGEEFLVVLIDAAQDAAHTIAERIRRRIGEEPVCFEGRPIPVTTSIGVASSHHHQQSVQSLVALADASLYEAKRKGRNRVVVGLVDATDEAPVPAFDRAARAG